MKNLIVVFAFLFALTGCNKDKNSGAGGAGIVIKGRISQTGSMKSSGAKSLNALPLSDAKKVFMVDLDNGILTSEIIDITDGSFTATASMGAATALVFLDADNKYIGTLASRGLYLLPLNKLTDGENTSINLADLTLSGTSVIPSHDPFGNEIIITDAEINRLKAVDGFFESLAKNIDANNDNILDVLNDKQLFIKTRFWVHASHWGMNSTTPLMSDIDLSSLGSHMQLDGGKGFGKPNSIIVSGPIENPYNDITTFFINSNGMDGFYSGINRTGGFFEKGTYSINIDGYNCTMVYSNNDASVSQLFVLPTLHTNSEGKVTSITLEYKLPDGTSIDPINFLTDLAIQFGDDAQNQYFSSPWICNANTGKHKGEHVEGVFEYTPATPIDISHLMNVTIVYNDLLGNTYFISWSK
jgi:hypothetical protein